jgi:hypothetical protein
MIGAPPSATLNSPLSTLNPHRRPPMEVQSPMSQVHSPPPLPNRRVPRAPSRVTLDRRFLRLPLPLRLLSLAITRAR